MPRVDHSEEVSHKHLPHVAGQPFLTSCISNSLPQKWFLNSPWPYSHPPKCLQQNVKYKITNPTDSLLSKVVWINKYRASWSRWYKQPCYTPHIYVYLVSGVTVQRLYTLEEGTWHVFGCVNVCASTVRSVCGETDLVSWFLGTSEFLQQLKTSC